MSESKQPVAGRDTYNFGCRYDSYRKEVHLEVDGVSICFTQEVMANLWHHLRRELPEELLYNKDRSTTRTGYE
jgi:hypothetical protein